MGGAKVFCSACRNRSQPKRIPYGAKRTRAWCDGCDADLVPPQPNKRKARQQGKKSIRKALRDTP